MGNYVGLENLRIAREINFWIQDTIICLVGMGVVEGQGATIILKNYCYPVAVVHLSLVGTQQFQYFFYKLFTLYKISTKKCFYVVIFLACHNGNIRYSQHTIYFTFVK